MDDQDAPTKVTKIDLPEGLTWEMAWRATAIIELWEETPGATDLELAVSLFRLFSDRENPASA